MKTSTIIINCAIILGFLLTPGHIFGQYFLSGGYQGGGHGSGGVSSGINDRTYTLEEGVFNSYPNPFLDETKINFTLKKDSRVKLEVFDISSRLVMTLLPSSLKNVGEHSVRWDGQNNQGSKVPKGIYYYRLQVDQEFYNKKIIRW